jgi:SAM-dependent methyltransferase
MMECDMAKKEEGACRDGLQGTPGETHGVPGADRDFWNGRASEFSEYATSTGYADRFIALMNPEPGWTVLDMGCGGGTLAIPLSRRVASVTAVDFSSQMIDIVRARCDRAGITNVSAVQGCWEDDWKSLGLVTHDVAIASRSLIGGDPQALIRKLSNAATKRVYISTLVGDGPFDRRLFESTGRRFEPGHDYLHFHGLLYKMGIRANIAFVDEVHRNDWENHEQALEDQRWMFRGRGLSAGEREGVQAYLKKNLARVDGRWRLPYSRDCQWALMWWSKA